MKISGEIKISRKDKSDTYRIATIHETMGPNWKDVFWFNNTPFVRKDAIIKAKSKVKSYRLVRED